MELIRGPEGLELRKRVGYRPADKPEIPPACRNCKHYAYDAAERMSLRGGMETYSRVAQRCVLHRFTVTTRMVCDRHLFAHADRRDR